MIGTFADKQLKKFWNRGSAKGVSAKDAERLRELLSALDAVTTPGDMDLSSFGFHALKGNRKGQYAVEVRANWRLVFEWQDGQAVRVRLEDYHGS